MQLENTHLISDTKNWLAKLSWGGPFKWYDSFESCKSQQLERGYTGSHTYYPFRNKFGDRKLTLRHKREIYESCLLWVTQYSHTKCLTWSKVSWETSIEYNNNHYRAKFARVRPSYRTKEDSWSKTHRHGSQTMKKKAKARPAHGESCRPVNPLLPLLLSVARISIYPIILTRRRPQHG